MGAGERELEGRVREKTIGLNCITKFIMLSTLHGAVRLSPIPLKNEGGVSHGQRLCSCSVAIGV